MQSFHVFLIGILGFYKGFGAVLVGGIPGVSIYLTSYEVVTAMECHHMFSNIISYD
jgi:hypothetical protein